MITTMTDLSDIERVKDAEHEFRRATTDAALADWARRWGESWIALGHATEGWDPTVTADMLEQVENDRDNTEARYSELQDIAGQVIKVLDGAYDTHPKEVETALAALENAL